MTKFSEGHYDILNLIEVKSNIQEKNILGYSIDYTVGGLFLFGGFKIDIEENNGIICNDAYLIHIKNDKAEYETLSIKIKPSIRCYHNSCTLLENYVIIFGGLNSEVPFVALNDLWVFNSLNKTFVEIKLKCKEKNKEKNLQNGINGTNEKGYISQTDDENCSDNKYGENQDYGSNDSDSKDGEDIDKDDSILDNSYVKNLRKYLKSNKSDELHSSDIPCPRYFSSLDLYIIRKNNIEEEKGFKKDEIKIIKNNIIVSNSLNYEYFSLILFGGYGGYDRSSYNDLYEFNILNNEWILRGCKGNVPSTRYGHISFIHGNNLFILGGTNAEISFNDMYSCDLKNNEWSEVDFSYSFNISKVFCRSVLVESIDRNIIFIFGGYNIISDEKGNRKIEYNNIELNMLKLYDTFKLEELKYNIIQNNEENIIKNNNMEEINNMNSNNVKNEIISTKHDIYEDSNISNNITFCSITYDFMDSNLIITDNKKKIYIMNISNIIGPKYAIFNIWPKQCDINGNKKLLFRGKGFTNEGKILVKYKSDDINLYSEGIYINENNIYTIVPNAKNKIKNNICQVQLSINDKCYTTNSCFLEYYYNIDPKNTLIFGSGLLEPVCLQKDNIFFLIAKNSLNEHKKI